VANFANRRGGRNKILHIGSTESHINSIFPRMKQRLTNGTRNTTLRWHGKYHSQIWSFLCFFGISAGVVLAATGPESATASIEKEINDGAAGNFKGKTPTTVFSATPSLQIITGEAVCSKTDLTKGMQERPRCVISRIGEGYYWASRNNTPLNRSESGIFVVFSAINGSGYIKILMPELKPAKSAASLIGVSGKHDYVEHLSHMLGGVTYYGTIDNVLPHIK
jgi:hypothetical protein